MTLPDPHHDPVNKPIATHSLNGGGWSLRLGTIYPNDRGVPNDQSEVPNNLVAEDIAASVPGCVHTDLLAAGLIPDPYLSDNERGLFWIGRCDWTYRCAFDVPPDLLSRQHVELCFDGLDTLATVLLNGQVVGRTRNMHRRYRFDVRSALRESGNDLEIRFAAPVPAMWDAQDALGELPREGCGSNPSLPFNTLRKMACNTGWDWGPVVPTCGIWREVRLEAWDFGRLGDVRPTVREATAERAVLEVGVDVTGRGVTRATLVPPGGGEAMHSQNLTFEIRNPSLWWPAGYGQQPLYMLTVELVDEDGDVVDAKRCSVGLRTIELDADDDEPDEQQPATDLGTGSRMRLLVNGKAVYCKGANWIPDDCFPHRVSSDRYRRRIGQALDANMNMLRVWGGGLYESHDFYDACDQMGVMVWQDFLAACAAYPEDEETKAEMDAEARDNVGRLARHPSLVLWNGCNENLWAWYEWRYQGRTWPDYVGSRGWGLHYYFETFPRAVAELAPSTPYWPGSPASGRTQADFDEVYPNDNEHGNRHVWNVWHGPGHYLNYLGHFPRFCSEFGFHGPACWPTIERSVPPDQRRWDSRVMRSHNKNGISAIGDGQDKSTARMADDFVVPEDVDDWLYLSQVMQARALTVGVGWFRSLFLWNNGALFWQLNDCWPCSSWSAVDGDGRAKPLLFAAKRFFAPRVVNLGPRRPTEVGGWGEDAGPLRAYLHNDAAEPWEATLRLRLMTYDGETVAELRRTARVPPRSAASVDVPTEWPRRADLFLVAEADGGERAFWWFAADKDAPLPTPRFDAIVEGHAVTVTAGTLLRDLCLFPDRLHPDAAADDACVTLLPGESFTFRVESPVPLDAALLTAPPVLRCVGDR